ncbi:MAG: methylmalonyl-CoA mutase [Candidatus Methanolliviera hydrocarbonicum]|jgi:methylmalonyl-CoA mutase N-terminal domain|uniref:Methylmalonyl-CoA mutase n=1 Tax=Candidatus Methanolliviera hydrocarbonicum TaxID=2491085 RepID=A0A520KV94_9EURY|nr:MAG: methylmalonyl-CoA mutase [Candidatus Methanolliviera hydrocarbonicum]
MKKERERKEEFRTTVGGTVLKSVYTASDVEEPKYEKLSLPGEYPFTRNIRSTGYRSRLWTMRQYAGFATVEETNRRYKYLYEQGQTGFSVAFHLPTQVGYDSDHPLSAGEVGRCGVAIDSLREMEDLWDGIPLTDVSTSMTINATAPIILAMYIVAAEKQGADKSKLRGTVQNDILKEYIARNTYIFGPNPSMRLVTDICSYCSQNMPRWNSISISGYHMREAGATAIQEAAFTIADGIAYVQAMRDRGMKVDSFAPRFSFFFAAYTNLLEEVAKFRALRRVWAKIMKERFGAKNPRSMMLRYHVQTDGFTLTKEQPFNNIVRVTIQALAAVLGGCQSLHTNSFDEALALPTEEAVKVALRTQQIIAYESGLPDTVDPLGGAYYIEWLTDRIEDGIMEYIDKIDEMGGTLEAIKRGYIQKEIMNSAYGYQKAVDSGEQVIVGLNKFTDAETEEEVNLLEIGEEAEKKQVERLKRLKRERDNEKVTRALSKVRQVARSNENIMPVLVEAVKTYATVGEITDVLRDVFGEYREPTII